MTGKLPVRINVGGTSEEAARVLLELMKLLSKAPNLQVLQWSCPVAAGQALIVLSSFQL